MKKLCVIPARGGSKRIPRKNIKDFLGKPIIAYSIEAAIRSNIFDEIMVSTDDEEIARISRKYGAKIPFLRSHCNSNDTAGLAEVLIEVINSYMLRGIEYDIISCVLPTAPFITPDKLNKAYYKLMKISANAIIPIVEFEYPIQKAFISEGCFIQMKWPENYTIRSQDLEPCYHDAGQFYFIRTVSLLHYKKLIVPKTTYIKYDSLEVQDIDKDVDWTLAELKFQSNFNS